MNLRLSVVAVAVSLLATGCAVSNEKKATSALADASYAGTESQVHQARDASSIAAKREAQVVNRPYIAGKARPLAREVTLPAPLRGDVNTVLLFNDDADLVTLASRIQNATGIMVKVTPDALLPLESFSPRLADSSASRDNSSVVAPMTASLDAPVALDAPLPVGGVRADGPRRAAPTIPTSSRPLRPNGSQPLPGVLDSIALRLGVYWKYDADIGALVFYRTETRSFEVRNAEFTVSSKMGIDLTGGIDASTSGIKSDSQSLLEVDNDESPMEAIVRRVEQYMTQAGQVAAGGGGLLVVTDTKTALDQISKYIEHENRMRSRRVEFVFEEITVERNDSDQGGINWNLMFESAGQGTGVNVSGLNSLLEQEGAALSLGASIGTGQWANTSVALQALSRVGKVVDRKLNTFGSNNGQPVTTGRPERQRYISEMEQTQSTSDSSAPTVSVSQETEVSGRLLTLLPQAYANGDINLALKYDNTPTPVFEKQVMPDGSYVQSPRSVTDVLVRTATVRSGQPFVISAYSHNSSSFDQRRTDRRLPMLFGGSDVVNQNDRVTVLVLTAMVRE